MLESLKRWYTLKPNDDDLVVIFLHRLNVGDPAVRAAKYHREDRVARFFSLMLTWVLFVISVYGIYALAAKERHKLLDIPLAVLTVGYFVYSLPRAIWTLIHYFDQKID